MACLWSRGWEMVGPLLRPRSVWIYLVFTTGISSSLTSLSSPSGYAVSFRTLSAGQSPRCLCPALIPRWLHVTCRVKPGVSVERAELSLVGVLPPHLVSPLGALPVDPLESILQPKALLGTLPYSPCCFTCFFLHLVHAWMPLPILSTLWDFLFIFWNPFEVLDHKLSWPLHDGSHGSVPLGLLLGRTDGQP